MSAPLFPNFNPVTHVVHAVTYYNININGG